MNQTQITTEEFNSAYIPFGMWLSLKKDIKPTKTAGGIIIPDTKVDPINKSSIGQVLRKSPLPLYENELEKLLFDAIEVGDWVGFTWSTPVASPSPQNICVEEEKNADETLFVTVHVTDIMGVYCSEKERQKEVVKKLKLLWSSFKKD